MATHGDTVRNLDEATVRKAVKAAALGNCMEWFDFGVYSYLAGTIGRIFFPSHSDSASLLSSFAVFAVAFLVRPLGGFFFGPLGDRVGRSKILAITIITMSAGTLAVGLIPGYNQIGIWAPVLLVAARLVQGFSAGGEYGGAATFVVESAPDERRGFLAAWLDFGTLAGYSLGASIVTALTLLLPQDAMSAWGWRVPFLLAGPLGLFGLWLRLRLEESTAFRGLSESGEVTRAPLKEALALNWRNILLCMGLVLILNVAYYDVLSYLPSYLSEELGIGSSTALMVIVGVMVGMMGLAPVLGRLSDRIGRKAILVMRLRRLHRARHAGVLAAAIRKYASADCGPGHPGPAHGHAGRHHAVHPPGDLPHPQPLCGIRHRLQSVHVVIRRYRAVRDPVAGFHHGRQIHAGFLRHGRGRDRYRADHADAGKRQPAAARFLGPARAVLADR